MTSTAPHEQARGATAFIDVDTDPEHVRLGVEGEFSHASFVRWLLGSLLVVLFVVGAVNWYVDATGVTGRDTRWRIGENAEVRSVKLDLFDALDAPPQIVLLGSSRVMKFDPDDVTELTGQRAFNASVSGGIPRDARLFVKLLAERQPKDFPHLVWGLDVDAFRDKQLRDGLAGDPRVQKFVPMDERIAGWVATGGTLIDWQTTKATIRSLRQGGRSDRDADAAPRFSATGMQLWSLPFPKEQVYLDRMVRKQIEQYAGFIFERDSFDGIEDEPLAEFREVLEIANAHGDTPTIFLTPYHPLAEQILAEHDIGAREREVRAMLHRLQSERDVRFELVDLTDIASFDGDPAQFYDGVHMTPKNTRRVLQVLDRDGLLGRSNR